MKRIDELQALVDNWEYKREVTDEEIKVDYIFLLTEIKNLKQKINIAKTALEE